MPSLDLARATALAHAGRNVAEVSHMGRAVWRLPPLVVLFPEIEGDYWHFREEDVTASGVNTANGLPLALDLVGTLARVQVGGVEWMDCSTGHLRAERDPWPAAAGFALWALIDGSRTAGAVDFYNGPPEDSQATNRIMFQSAQAKAASGRISSMYVQWEMPPASGPETVCWHRPSGSATALGAYTMRRNGLLLAGPTGQLTRQTVSDGSTFIVGGATGNATFGGLRWRDVVLKIGADFTPPEVAALEAYAVARLTP